MFQPAVQSPRDVRPTERPFHLPPLAAIAPGMDILRRAAAREGDMILARRGEGNHAPLAQGLAVRFALRAFVQPQAVGVALTLADTTAIEGLQQLGEVIAVGFTECAVQGMPIALTAQMPFQPFNPLLSRVADCLRRPFLDLPTLASWEQVLRLSIPRRFAARIKSATMRCQTRRRWYSHNRRLQVLGAARLSCGISSQRHPGCKPDRIPLSTSRSSSRGRPVRAGRGMRRLSRAHWAA